ncbi:heme NO-binding domain-containing protein [Rhodoflexus sp.]
MKGTIHNCLGEMVRAKYGTEAWQKCLTYAGMPYNRRFSMVEDVGEIESLQLITSSAQSLGVSLQQLFDEFGEYWCCTYAPAKYSYFYIKFRNAKEMILQMDRVHANVGSNFANAKPPRFFYKWEDETQKHLIVTYQSERNLIDLYIALAKGVGKYFNEPLTLEKLSEKQVRITFA